VSAGPWLVALRRTTAGKLSLLLLAVVLAVSGVAVTSARDDTYALPSSGWKPGDGIRPAGYGGEFHAERVGDGACGWLGDGGDPILWPKGWRVAFNPTRLLDDNGDTFALDGEYLRGSGWLVSPQMALTACGGDPRRTRAVAMLDTGSSP
jgi:hypothetical protein